MCFHAEKRIAGIGRGRQSVMASRFLQLSPCLAEPGFPRPFRGPSSSGKRFVVLILRLNRAAPAHNPIIPMMFPGCFHNKGKDQ